MPSAARDAVGQLLRAVTGRGYDDPSPVATLAGFPTVAVGPSEVVVLNAHGFRDCRSGRSVELAEIEAAHADTHQGAFGVDHSLRLVLKPRRHSQPTKRRFITTSATSEDEVEVSLDQLSLSWEEVADAVEAKLGRRLIRTSNSGL